MTPELIALLALLALMSLLGIMAIILISLDHVTVSPDMADQTTMRLRRVDAPEDKSR